MNALSAAWLLVKDTLTGVIDGEGPSRGAEFPRAYTERHGSHANP